MPFRLRSGPTVAEMPNSVSEKPQLMQYPGSHGPLTSPILTDLFKSTTTINDSPPKSALSSGFSTVPDSPAGVDGANPGLDFSFIGISKADNTSIVDSPVSSTNRPRRLIESIRGWTWGSAHRRRDRNVKSSNPSSPSVGQFSPTKTSAGVNRLSTGGIFSRLSRTQSRHRTVADPISPSVKTSTSHKGVTTQLQVPVSQGLPMTPSQSSTGLSPPLRVWTGAGTYHEYPGLTDDSDLWMPSGDCVIVTTISDGTTKPIFRVHAAVLSQARSNLLARLVRAGRVRPVIGSLSDSNSRLGSCSSRRGSDPSLLEEECEPEKGSCSLNTVVTHEVALGLLLQPFKAALDPSDLGPSHSPNPRHRISDGRQELAIRNFLALLYGKPLVGTDFFEMLSDLHLVLDCYFATLAGGPGPDGGAMPVSAAAAPSSTVSMIVAHLTELGLDDVRNNLDAAFGILAWAEQPSVRWTAGFFEAFVHAVGMMDGESLNQPPFQRLSRSTRHRLENAYIAMQLRLLATADRLVAFEVSDFGQIDEETSLWKSVPAMSSAASRFSAFLRQFYQTEFGEWPPMKHTYLCDLTSESGVPTNPGRWLSRSLSLRLQSDLGILYDHLVDRSVCWQETTEKRLEFGLFDGLGSNVSVSRNPFFQNPSFASAIATWDDRQGYDKIPLPFPLFPEAQNSTVPPSPVSAVTSPTTALRPRKKASAIFQLRTLRTRHQKADSSISLSGSALDSVPSPTTVTTQADHLKLGIALTTASNKQLHAVSPSANRLLDAFTSFERTDTADHGNMNEARLGRWIVIYAALQSLSMMAVDVGGLKYSAGVDYFLCASIGSVSASQDESDWQMFSRFTPSSDFVPASQSRSHCWNRFREWRPLTEHIPLSASRTGFPEPVILEEPERCNREGTMSPSLGVGLGIQTPSVADSGPVDLFDRQNLVASAVGDHPTLSIRTSGYGSTLGTTKTTNRNRLSIASSAFSFPPVPATSLDTGSVSDLNTDLAPSAEGTASEAVITSSEPLDSVAADCDGPDDLHQTQPESPLLPSLPLPSSGDLDVIEQNNVEVEADVDSNANPDPPSRPCDSPAASGCPESHPNMPECDPQPSSVTPPLPSISGLEVTNESTTSPSLSHSDLPLEPALESSPGISSSDPPVTALSNPEPASPELPSAAASTDPVPAFLLSPVSFFSIITPPDFIDTPDPINYFDEFDGLDELASDLEQQYQAASEAVVYSPPPSKRCSALIVVTPSTNAFPDLAGMTTDASTEVDDSALQLSPLDRLVIGTAIQPKPSQESIISAQRRSSVACLPGHISALDPVVDELRSVKPTVDDTVVPVGAPASDMDVEVPTPSIV